MSDELINILNEDLTVLKACLKSEAHTYGHLHASVHIWFYTVASEVLLQKRSPNKIAHPNLWDVSVAGHISAGESEVISAIREVKEEIGLYVSANELLKIGSFRESFTHKADFIDNEIHHTYICKLSKDIEQLKLQEEEVTAIKLIPIDEFKAALKKVGFENVYVPHTPDYYNFVLKTIRKQLI